MSSKLAVLPLISNHVRTLRDARTARLRWQDFAAQMGAPLAIGFVVVAAGSRLVDSTQIIAGAAVMAGFSFGLAISVFQLRLESARDPRVDKGGLLLVQLDELFTNVSYSVLAGLVLVVVSTAGAAFHSSSGGNDPLGAAWTFAITSLGLQYITTILMCLKRLQAAYREMTI